MKRIEAIVKCIKVDTNCGDWRGLASGSRRSYSGVANGACTHRPRGIDLDERIRRD